MIQFKKLIVEQEKRGVARELNKLLQTRFRNDLPKLYRATKREFASPYKVYEFEGKIREPKGSSLDSQIVLDAVAETIDPDIPKRFKSKFASTEYIEGSGVIFGRNTYFVFPDRTANIVSFSKDTMDLRGDVDAMIAEITGSKRKQYPKFVKMFDKMDKLSYKKFIGWMENNWDEIRNELENGGESGRKMLETIDDYFGAMKQGVKKGSKEIVFDGNYYLYVKPDFFNEYFERQGGIWKLKEEK